MIFRICRSSRKARSAQDTCFTSACLSQRSLAIMGDAGGFFRVCFHVLVSGDMENSYCRHAGHHFGSGHAVQ